MTLGEEAILRDAPTLLMDFVRSMEARRRVVEWLAAQPAQRPAAL